MQETNPPAQRNQPASSIFRMAANEAYSAIQIRLKETDSKLLHAIEDALMRIRQERFGICEECGQPISKARLEAVPWAGHCKGCKKRKESRS